MVQRLCARKEHINGYQKKIFGRRSKTAIPQPAFDGRPRKDKAGNLFHLKPRGLNGFMPAISLNVKRKIFNDC